MSHPGSRFPSKLARLGAVLLFALLVDIGRAGAQPLCATPGKDGPGGVLAGVVNTYYPPALGVVAAGSTSIALGAARGAPTAIAAGDLLLVIQIQDAAIDSTNTGAYGDGIAGDPARGSTLLNGAGLYEYVVASSGVPLTGGVLTLQGLGVGGGLLNAYTNQDFTATQGQRRFQVVRVPQYTTATLGPALTASRWNGATGGILAFDVSGALDLGTTTVSVDALGFRGGGGRGLTGAAGGSNLDYRTLASQNFNGAKGEGIAGTPVWVLDLATNTVVSTGAVEGYPNGSMARGAPGNAGGGGTDGNTSANDQNSGGGGGGNGGIGGQGGNTWNSNLAVGGFGGAAFPATPALIVLGGGGGAGTRNNSAGADSSGGAGGGIVLVRAASVTGTGTITANGGAGSSPANDGGGGGGAGGTIVVITSSGNLGGLTVATKGGSGGNAWPTQAVGTCPDTTNCNYHGPGGGGAGGVILLSSAPAASDVSGGANGTTTTGLNTFGATAGAVGIFSSTASQIPGVPAQCPPTPTPTFTNTPTATPTLTPSLTPTITPSPTSTATAT
ncbi:MAG TPA: hypothetical protein VL084_15230, partial [Thermoanaerobaculia bacterium]|nr:hypothetical protein [Thermoanaerobaculia bacterium]